MTKKIDSYLKSFTNIPLEDLTYDNIYHELICHENSNLRLCSKTIDDIYESLIVEHKSSLKLSNKSLYLFSKRELSANYFISLGIFLKLSTITESLDKLITYLHKKKYLYQGNLSIYYNVGYLTLNFQDFDDAKKIIDYLNNRHKEYLYSVNPLFFAVDNVMVSLTMDYSYPEIITNYLISFINEMHTNKQDIDYQNFKIYMLNKYYKLDNQQDMHLFKKYNNQKITLSKFYYNLEVMTNLILYLFNGNDLEEMGDYYKKNTRKSNKILSKYLDYDDLTIYQPLFEELVTTMYESYGETKTKENILAYSKTGQVDYLTRKNNLRKKIVAAKPFLTYLDSLSLNKELTDILSNLSANAKKKILSNACCETFKVCWASSDLECAKVQVARSLIRLSYGDYSMITRNNDARKQVIDNLNTNEIIDIIKNSLEIAHYNSEQELYEVYAEYIEKLCL